MTSRPQPPLAFLAPEVDDFSRVLDSGSYVAIPSDAFVAVTDVVGSTRAIQSGLYKHVNLAGAAGIAAFANAIPDVELPFSFGGDGASFIVPAAFCTRAAAVLSGLQAGAQRALGLELRAALVPISELRARGADVRLVYHRLPGGRRLAMLSGGGVGLAETLSKQDEGRAFLIQGNDQLGEPNLDGLSCRWQPIKPQRGVMLSLVVAMEGPPDVYIPVFDAIAKAAAGPQSPITRAPFQRWPPANLRVETQLVSRTSPLRYQLGALAEAALSLISTATGVTIGGFDGRAYRASLAQHCDAMKFADSLKMVIDCTPAEADAVSAALDDLSESLGFAYGLQRSNSALMTCFVQSTVAGGHLHFVDGADGGYAMAAQNLKRRSERASLTIG